MKKILLLISAGAFLASCGGTLVSDTATLTSQYLVSNLNYNGQNYSGPVICDNLTTNLTFSFSYFGATPTSVTALLVGSTGATQGLNVTGVNDAGDQLAINFVASPETVPLKVGSGVQRQAIVVNPVVSGSTKVRFSVNLTGSPSVVRETQFVPVIKTCSF